MCKFLYPISFLILSFVFSCRPEPSEIQLPGFEVQPVDNELMTEMVEKGVFSSNSPVPAERLRVVKVRHYDFNDQVKQGELVVLDAVSDHVKQIFQELFQRKFRMEQVRPITRYGGSDSLSMADNNTSAHNLRPIAGGERISLHAYGTAIDVNPVQNPFVEIPCDDSLGIALFHPVAGIKYANRTENRPGRENRRGMAERAVDVFADHGFYWWGGYWNCPIDYQHFQISRGVTELLTAMPTKEATAFFNTVVNYYNESGLPIEDALSARMGEKPLVSYYLDNPDRFMKIVDEFR